MIRLIGAEWRKLATTRTTWGFFIGVVLLTLMFVMIPLLASSSVDTRRDVVNVISSAGISSLIILVLGTAGMTGEYRHGTIAGTFLVEPRRWRVILAKAIAYGLAGLAFAVAALGLAGVVVLLWLTKEAASLRPTTDEVLQLVAGTMATAFLFGAFGVGVGAIFRSQVGAVTTVLVFWFIVEPLLASASDPIGTYGPSGAVSSLSGGPGAGDIAQGAGALLMLGYSALVLAIGTAITENRDVEG